MPEMTLRCRNCTGVVTLRAGQPSARCPHCGRKHARPKSEAADLDCLRRADQLCDACDFANAAAAYQQVLYNHPDEHEALWGLVKCKYGVENIYDPETGRKWATLHLWNKTPIEEDSDFGRACKCAPPEMAEQYRAEAAYIASVQQLILSIDRTQSPCDVFLCYKDGDGSRELAYAGKLEQILREEGYRVFFAHETLRNAAGKDYEAQIFHALHVAPVMLVVCSDPANLRTPWVHSEWARYLARMDRGEEVCLIPLLYDGYDPEALPAEFIRRNLQGLCMSEVDALDKLRQNLSSCIPRTEAVQPLPPASPQDGEEADALAAIEYALAEKDWDTAERLATDLVRRKGRCSRGYLYKMMARMKVATLDALEMVEQPFENDIDWQWALRHADAAERSVLSKMQHSRVMRLQAEIRMQHSEIQRGLQAMQTEQNRIYQQMLQMYEQKIQQDMASHHATMAELVECAGERAREREGLQEQQIRLQAAQMEIARREEELQHIRNAQQTESAGKARSSGDGKGFWTRLAMGMLSVAGSAVVLLGMLWCLLASPEKTQTIIFCFATMPWAVLGVNLFIMFLKDYEWSWLDLLSLLFAVPLLIAVILHIVTPPDSMPWLWIASAIFAVSGCFPWLGCGSDLRHLGADRGGNVNWAESVLMASAGAACPYCILMILQHLTGNALPHELLDVARCLIGVVPMCFAMAPYKGAKGPEST